ncbi:MAG: polysaccharide biosynthesis protein [Lachnospiraceae bacterium]|nr:polysaccharide biosynthesis protein [Lachnospiraceae bacterium]
MKAKRRTSPQNNNFLMQGSILAVASIVSRVIGLVYRVPMQRIIGDVGMDYYSSAYEVYSILLIISSYSLPTAVSKLVSARMEKGQKKNAFRIVRGAFLFAFVSGGAVAVLVFFGADFLTREVLNTPLAVFSLRVLSPCLLIAAFLGVIRGFFQGLGTMIPSAVSQIIEQIVNAVVSVAAAFLLFGYGERIGRVLGDPEKIGSAYGAVGGTIGTVTGAAVGLIFIFLIYLMYRTVLKRQMRRDRSSKEETAGAVASVLILTIVPVLLSSTIYNISSFIDNGVFKAIALQQGYSTSDISIWWGKYTGKYKLIINVPIAIASALAASSVPALAASWARGDKERINSQIDSAIRFTMVIALPCTAGIGVLARPILTMLFNDTSDIAANMLTYGCVAIAFYSLSTLSNGLLQGINRLRLPVINAVIALVLHLGALAIMMYAFHLDIFAVIYANVIYAFLMCVLNQIGLWKAVHYRMNVMKAILKPALAAAIMGAGVFGLYKLFEPVLANTISTILSILLGCILYLFLLLLFRSITKAELERFPGGKRVARLAIRLHLLKEE